MISDEYSVYDPIKQDLIEIARRACANQLQAGSGGNLSIRIPGKGLFVIKPSGKGFMELSLENLLVVDLDGQLVHGSAKPSRDTMSHAGIYKLRPDVGGILHVHATWALVYALDGCEIPLMTEEAIDKVGTMPVVPCIPGKLSQLHQEVAATFSNSAVKVALLAKHGLIAAGKTLQEAAELCELANESAKLAYLYQLRQDQLRQAGFPSGRGSVG
jgi:L-ribulose-5-phosphate 4-epimerase